MITINSRLLEMPIYRTAFEVNTYIDMMVKSFPKYYRVSLADPMRNDSMEIVLSIQKALVYEELETKKSILESVFEVLHRLVLYLRMAREYKLISGKKQSYVYTRISHIEKQAYNWKMVIDKKVIKL